MSCSTGGTEGGEVRGEKCIGTGGRRLLCLLQGSHSHRGAAAGQHCGLVCVRGWCGGLVVVVGGWVGGGGGLPQSMPMGVFFLSFFLVRTAWGSSCKRSCKCQRRAEARIPCVALQGLVESHGVLLHPLPCTSLTRIGRVLLPHTCPHLPPTGSLSTPNHHAMRATLSLRPGSPPSGRPWQSASRGPQPSRCL